MKKIFAILSLFLYAPAAFAALRTEIVEYKHGETVLEGYLAYNDAISALPPGVLIVHEWTGLGPYARKRAEQLAAMGYVAFAVDMYGKGIRPSNPADAGKEAGIYKNDRKLMRERAKAGLDYLVSQPFVNREKIAAIGYCFGGTTVLEMARAGHDLDGVVSFHGGLSTPSGEDAKNIKAKVLVLHGADDPYAPKAEVDAFESEMKAGGVKDWQVHLYSGAVHSFTNPDAGNDPTKGAAYDAVADRRSWEATKDFLAETLA